jgi:hypothetical protein
MPSGIVHLCGLCPIHELVVTDSIHEMLYMQYCLMPSGIVHLRGLCPCIQGHRIIYGGYTSGRLSLSMRVIKRVMLGRRLLYILKFYVLQK